MRGTALGIFGGTFNPIHLGHLRAAEEIRQLCGLSRVVFVPAYLPPHKHAQVAPAPHRLAMVRCAVRGNPFFSVSDIELRRSGTSYSFETIQYFNSRLHPPDELFFIIGSDAFREIYTWKYYPDFFSACHFIVMDRPGESCCFDDLIPPDIRRAFKKNRIERLYEHRSGYRVFYRRVTLLDISSTAVRRAVQSDASIKYMVPDAVERYIYRHALYRKARGG
ncbi:MAG: nicotinate-nucleotide adenylyltransferase [Desulfobacterota bacterium]|nr:nicotinate-nucleotide adenylyltransferase [Thermodesulfobacteriota bacterium]